MKIFENERIIAFFSSKDYLSNFYPCTIIDNGKTFTTAEQLFMYKKAVFFNDHSTASQILYAKTPQLARKIGRQVKNFNAKQWSEASFDIMKEVLKKKFVQNKELFNKFTDKSIFGYTFVEASPYDKIWGCGFTEDEEEVKTPRLWKGQNQLGKVLNTLQYELEEVRSYTEIKSVTDAFGSSNIVHLCASVLERVLSNSWFIGKPIELKLAFLFRELYNHGLYYCQTSDNVSKECSKEEAIEYLKKFQSQFSEYKSEMKLEQA